MKVQTFIVIMALGSRGFLYLILLNGTLVSEHVSKMQLTLLVFQII